MVGAMQQTSGLAARVVGGTRDHERIAKARRQADDGRLIRGGVRVRVRVRVSGFELGSGLRS